MDIEQRNALGLLAIRLQEDMFAIGLIFFVFTRLSLGYLIFRSGFLPRAIGVLMCVAAGAYILNSFAHILSPSLAAQLVPGIFAPIFIAELSLALWLTVKGVDGEVWRARALAAGWKRECRASQRRTFGCLCVLLSAMRYSSLSGGVTSSVTRRT